MKEINSIAELTAFLKGIPADKWCVDIRTNFNGKHCVMGHLDKMTGDARPWNSGGDRLVQKLGLSVDELVIVNNGRDGYSYDTPRSGGTDGESIKSRVITYLEAKQ